MNFKPIEDVANAVLYEGYLLYPYRPSAVKNRQRWNFGVLYPREYSEPQNGPDRWFVQTQCLVAADESARLDIKVRFLQAVSREVGKLRAPAHEWQPDTASEVEIIDAPETGDGVLRPWQEALERDLELRGLRVGELIARPLSGNLKIAGGCEFEPVKNKNGAACASIVRRREGLKVRMSISAERCTKDVIRLTIKVSNQTECPNPKSLSRDEMLLKSLLSAHVLVGIDAGQFFSLADPPEAIREIAAACTNEGVWPVLAGETGSSNAMLASPIILYDHPQLAPESAGNLFDSTEIDEILTLRILTLSDDEKQAIRESDNRARELLARTESLPMEQLLKLHGALRDVTPAPEATNKSVEPAERWSKQ